MSFLNKLLGDPNKKHIQKFEPIVAEINALEKKYQKFSDSDFKNETEKFKKIIAEKRKAQNIPEKLPANLKKDELKEIQKKEQQILNEILASVFALVREAAVRTIGQRHFDVQLMGGIALHQGKVVEMKTGEGKTLVATLPLYLNALLGRGVHLVTVNDFLAKSHTQWMGPIYNLLGMSVSCIQQQNLSFIFEPREKEIKFGEDYNLKRSTRQEAYKTDIIYGQNNEFGFDYLRDNMVTAISEQAQREQYFAIVDEVDSILIDEARTPLIISAPAEESAELYYKFARFVPSLKENEDFNIDEKMQAVTLTDAGIQKAENFLGIKNLYTEGGIRLVHHLEEALRAQTLFKKDRDYVIKDGEIIIVDQFTGRLMHGRRYSEGLHQAIEAKENVEIKRESVTLATISFQNYFRMYGKLAGMTGTAVTEAEEFYKIYGLETLEIPTNETMIREDLGDRIYKSDEGKFQAVVEEIKKRSQKGQPVLVGTIAIEKSELLSGLLRRQGIKHNVLNAKHHEKEAKIIASAGEPGAVTVATNMAGRGVDIILGGRTPFDKIKLKEWQKEHQDVVSKGGLFVLGTERHEARRIDNQLRGRSGRQGDPGASQFYVSMEDDLMRIFGGDRIKRMMEVLKLPEDQPIENRLISRSLESAQKRVEGHNFDIRKHLVEYDDVMNKHREYIYNKRKEILTKADSKEEILELVSEKIDQICELHAVGTRDAWNIKEILENIKAIFGLANLPEDFDQKIEKLVSQEELKANIKKIAQEIYQEKEAKTNPDLMRIIEKTIYLRTIDTLWIDHLTEMEELRQGIGLVGYGQRDPLVEYKNSAYNMFRELLAAISHQVVGTVFKVELAQRSQEAATGRVRPLTMSGPSEQSAAGTFSEYEAGASSAAGTTPMEKETSQRNTKVDQFPKAGRNDPCPCNSGKKFKKCHGR